MSFKSFYSLNGIQMMVLLRTLGYKGTFEMFGKLDLSQPVFSADWCGDGIIIYYSPLSISIVGKFKLG